MGLNQKFTTTLINVSDAIDQSFLERAAAIVKKNGFDADSVKLNK